MTSFTATSLSAVQTEAVLKDDRISTDECCEVTPKGQLAQTFPHLMAKPLGVKTPGWTPRSIRTSQWGLQEAARQKNLLETLTASELSHKTGQVEGRTEKLLALHTTAALSCDCSIKQHEALSVGDDEGRAQLRVLSTLQGLVHSCWLLGKSSNTSRFSRLKGAYSKQQDLAKWNLFPRTDSVLLLSYNITKIWLRQTQDCKESSSTQTRFPTNGKQWQDTWKLTLTP